jgi:3-phosphoglycerate kinase
MKYIDEVSIINKRIFLRTDYNVSLTKTHAIADDNRITQSLPTIKLLLEQQNRIIIGSHLGKPKGKDAEFSLSPVAEKLRQYLPSCTITLVDDFRSKMDLFHNQKANEILLLENLRFYPEEKANDPAFAKELAALADIYVNDGFSVSHREDASIVGIPPLLPSFGGLLLKKELQMIAKIIQHPQKPFVAILGGSKISTKITLIERLLSIADTILVGGGIADNFLVAQGHKIGKSILEPDNIQDAEKLLIKSKAVGVSIILPTDVVVGDDDSKITTKAVHEITETEAIFDIGPTTRALFQNYIAGARTIIWNGPVGFFEQESFRSGTDSIYEAIIANPHAASLIGGGDTLAAIAEKPDRDRITHISTGGGAMLTLIANGTLPGIKALDENPIVN